MLARNDMGMLYYQYTRYPQDETELVIHSSLLPLVDNDFKAAIVLGYFIDQATLQGSTYVIMADAGAFKETKKGLEETHWSPANSAWISERLGGVLTEEDVATASDLLAEKGLLATRVNEDGELIARPSESLEN